MVPDIPSFAFDDGFAYRVPPELAGQAAVGSLVRVPLAGRRVRGYVIGLEEGGAGPETGRLKDVRSLAAPVPVFTPALLESLRWAARHYAAPLSAVLAKAGPPNLPKQAPPLDLPGVPPAAGPVPELSEAAAAGRGPGRTVQLIAAGGWAELIREAVSAPVRAEKSVLVAAPTAVEAAELAGRLRADLGSRVVEVSDQQNASITSAWSQAAAQGGLVVVGTLRVGWWPVKDLSMMVLVEDGRRAMKERQTPTVAVRTLAAARSSAEGLQLLLVGRLPTVQTLYEDAAVVRVPGRLWAPVEIVDRTEDPPGGGVVATRVRAAVAAVRRRGGRVFVFTHRRGYAPASRCAQCRRLRSCPSCGSRPAHRADCPRCRAELGPCPCGGTRFEPLGAGVGRVIEELRRVAGEEVGSVDSGRRVMVGTERDLTAAPAVDLAVAVDADGLVRGTNYRSAEDALAVLARTAASVRRGSGCRMMVQTAEPGHPIYTALLRADPFPFLRGELAARRRFSLPPCGEVLVVEVTGEVDPAVLEPAFEGAAVYGPAQDEDRTRWMVQDDDLRKVKGRLRPAVGRLRDKGVKVRVDVDPREF